MGRCGGGAFRVEDWLLARDGAAEAVVDISDCVSDLACLLFGVEAPANVD